jgi:hypothetical protein
MQGKVTRSKLIMDPDAFVVEGRRIQYPQVENASPSIRQGRVLAEASNSVGKKSPCFNHLESRGRLWNAQVQVVR